MTNRRANGEGSVYRRGNGRYVGKYEALTASDATSAARPKQTLVPSGVKR
jgi:hypothetical protein